MMKKIFLVLLISFMGLSIVAMERLEESGQIAQLPKELWSEILLFLTKAKSEKESFKDVVTNLKNVSLINKEFYKLLQNEVLLRLLVKEISKDFNVTEMDVGVLFGKRYLDSLLNQFRLADVGDAKEIMYEILQKNHKKIITYFLQNGISLEEINRLIRYNILKLALLKQVDTI